MVDVTYEQAKAIVDLADKISNNLRGSTDVIVGVFLDGVAILEGVEHIFGKRKCNLGYRTDYICASSTFNFIDKHKLNELMSGYKRRIYVDWRTVTGSLGKLLKENDDNCLYAVLSDSEEKADIRATKQDVPKLEFPKDITETMTIIGLHIDLKKLKSGEKTSYYPIQTLETNKFYNLLFKAIDDVMEKR